MVTRISAGGVVGLGVQLAGIMIGRRRGAGAGAGGQFGYGYRCEYKCGLR